MVPAGVAITGLEAELPARVLDGDLAQLLGLPVEEVRRWSRGRERCESPDGEGPAALAARAASRLLERKGLAPTDIDFLVFATNTPDMFFPGSACLLQAALPFRTVGSVDVRSQCTGFLTALDVARRFVSTGTYRRVLVAGADTPSHFNARDGRSPHLACAMGDGAAVALLEQGSGEGELLSIRTHSDGALHRDWWCEFPASRHREGEGFAGRDRLPASRVAAGLHLPVADLDRLHAVAIERLPAVFAEALAAADVDRVDATLLAHLDGRVEAEVPPLLGAPAGRVEVPDLVYLGGASLPVLMARLQAGGRLRAGETVALLAAGAGATWGGAVVRVPA